MRRIVAAFVATAIVLFPSVVGAEQIHLSFLGQWNFIGAQPGDPFGIANGTPIEFSLVLTDSGPGVDPQNGVYFVTQAHLNVGPCCTTTFFGRPGLFSGGTYGTSLFTSHAVLLGYLTFSGPLGLTGNLPTTQPIGLPDMSLNVDFNSPAAIGQMQSVVTHHRVPETPTLVLILSGVLVGTAWRKIAGFH